MAKKKKPHKKHHYKTAPPRSAVAKTALIKNEEAPVTALTAPVPAVSAQKPAANYEVANLGLIKQDVRKVALLASTFVVIQLVLWFLFEHTGFGAAVYNFVKL